ncbi:OmpA/MotB family protein [Halomonas sp. WWR20]
MLEQHRSASRHEALLAIHADERDGEAWMVSYIDILTLLVALFVLLLAVSGQAGSLGDVLRQEAPASARTAAMPAPFVTPVAQRMALDVSRLVGRPAPAPLDPAAISSAVALAGSSTITPQARMAAISVAAAPAISEAAKRVALQVAKPPTLEPQALAVALEVAEAARKAMELPRIDGVEVSRIQEGINLRIQDHLLFDSADAALTDSGREVIQRLVAMLNELDGTISVEGHSDSRPISTPRFPSNWELSSMRATAILRYLSDAGIDSSRMRAIGYADTQPIASNDTLQGRAANRRVEVIIHETR